MGTGYLSMGQQGLRQAEEHCIQEHPPACTAACPVHVDVRAMAAQIGRGEFTAALNTLRKAVPFPGIISRVCGQPCRAVCKRGEKGDPIAISALERACADLGIATTEPAIPVRPGAARIAVVGGGLSGATAALYLARKGYPVQLFEAADRLGGSLWSIPNGTLPGVLILEELDILRQVGVGIILNARIGREAPFESVCREFDAVYLAVGADSPDSFDLQLDDRGRIAVAAVTFATRRDGVFAGGALRQDSRGASAIDALADGRYAATSIDRYLQGASLTAAREREGSYTTRLFTSTEGVEPLPEVLVNNPASGYSPEEAAREAGRCLQCECMECVKVCGYLARFGSYPKRYLRQVYNNLAIVSGNHTANKLINSCSLCGLCGEVCPETLDMGEVCLEAREIMVSRGKMPPSVHDFALRDMLFSVGENFAMARHQPGSEASAFLFFPGCQLAASSPNHVEATYHYLMERLSGGVGLMLGCCGAPAEWAGRSDLSQGVWDWIAATWREMGRPRWVLACSSCLRTFKVHAPAGMEAVSLWELMDELGLPPRPAAAGEADAVTRLAVQDPCSARHDTGLQNGVRNLLSRLGYAVEEPALSRVRTECCGYGGLMAFANPDLAHEVVKKRVEASPTDYVTYCAMCRDRFAGQGKRTWHLLDLIFGPGTAGSSGGADSAGGVDPASMPGPGYSQRHENRARLKRRLLKELWRDDVKEPEGWETIRLSMSPEVAERLEKRLILVEDVQQVIDLAERTGRKLLAPGSGHFLAHSKPAAVTYWVEYSKQGDEFMVHNAYSHRMVIQEEDR